MFSVEEYFEVQLPQHQAYFRARIRRVHMIDVAGRQGWRARYVKEVDANETTLRFWQEIFDEKGKLAEIHEQYPIDKGHQKA